MMHSFSHISAWGGFQWAVESSSRLDLLWFSHCDWLKKTYHFLHHLEVKPKPIVTFSVFPPLTPVTCISSSSLLFNGVVWVFCDRLSVIMSYRKHGFRVPTERCFKQTALKYVNASIIQFCCPASLIFITPSANIPVSPRFSGEFDGRCLSARHFEKPLSPSSTQLTKNHSLGGHFCQVMVTSS